MYKAIQKTLDWGVKFASLAVTGPATWAVATRLFSDVQSPALLFAMRFAAVFLVEGVLLSNWLLLEFDKQATPEIKARYGLTALTMYSALLVIAWEHEGPVGIVFRLALLAALIGSGWDTYVYTWQRMTANVDRSPENSGKVKKNARELAIKEAIEKRRSESRVTLNAVELHEAAELQRISNEHQRIMAGLQLEHRDQLRKLKVSDSEKATPKRGNLTYPIERINEDRRVRKGERLEYIGVLVGQHPELNPSDVVELVKSKTGVSDSTAWSDWGEYKELATAGHGNGNGHVGEAAPG